MRRSPSQQSCKHFVKNSVTNASLPPHRTSSALILVGLKKGTDERAKPLNNPEWGAPLSSAIRKSPNGRPTISHDAQHASLLILPVVP
jgi:hypothetical protein